MAGYPGLGVGRPVADCVIVLGLKHRLGFGEYHSGWQASGIQVLGCALTVQAHVLFQPGLSGEPLLRQAWRL
jgi:hypothetical protein